MHSRPIRLGASFLGALVSILVPSFGAYALAPADAGLLPFLPPAIRQHPHSREYSTGFEPLRLEVKAKGERLEFQWLKAGVPIPGAVESWLTLKAVPTSAGDYAVKVSNPAGSITSEVAVLSLAPSVAPSFEYGPKSQDVRAGDPLRLSAFASGHPDPVYQWRKDGVALVGATESSLRISDAETSDGGRYDVVVSNGAGSATSAAVNVVVRPLEKPVIRRHPFSHYAIPGERIELSVHLENPHRATYSWRRNGHPIPGAEGSELEISSAERSDAGDYTVVVTNPAGSTTSEVAEIQVSTVAERPIITVSTGSSAEGAGATVWFAVGSSEKILAVQWFHDGVPLSDQRSSYFSAGAAADRVGVYRAVVKTERGTQTSRPMRFTFLEPSGPPRIREQPSASRIESGNPASLSVHALGAEPITYQWRRNGTPIPGATTDWLQLDSVTANNAGAYDVVVSNRGGATTSDAVTFAFEIEPETPFRITAQPASLTLTNWDQGPHLAVQAESRHPISYQWFKDGALLGGATSSTLVLDSDVSSLGRYHATVTAGAESIRSRDVTVSAESPGPRFANYPRFESWIPEGDRVELELQVNGEGPLTLQWRRDGIAVPGATMTRLVLPRVTPADAGVYVLAARDATGHSISAPIVLRVSALPLPAFLRQPLDVACRRGAKVVLETLAMNVSGDDYQWFKNGRLMPGATSRRLELADVRPEDEGRYLVQASNELGVVTSREAEVLVGRPVSSTYFGDFGPGRRDGAWAIALVDDRIGWLFAVLPGQTSSIVQPITVWSDGTFHFWHGFNSTRDQQAWGEGRIHADGSVTMPIDPLGLTMVGSKANGAAASAAIGHYEGVPLYAATGAAHVVVGPDGRCFGLLLKPGLMFGGAGSVISNTVTIAGGTGLARRQLELELNSADMTAAGRLTLGFESSIEIASARPASRHERLVNLSTRSRAGTGSATMIAGFVVTGDQSKTMLIRAAGPALRSHGVSDVLEDPYLVLYRGTVMLHENDDWGRSTNPDAIAAATAAVGAFSFADASKDAGLLVSLPPGNYTAHVTSQTAHTGVVLLEVYDVAGGDRSKPRLINLSARSAVGRGDDVLIAGFVVTGDAPRRFLVRGIGAALQRFGVRDVLADPRLRLYRGSQLVCEADDWVWDAEIADVQPRVGAFPVDESGRDASMLVYLEPGLYSAHVSGVDNTIGVALVEVYEVP